LTTREESTTSLAFEYLFNKMSKEIVKHIDNVDEKFIVANDDLTNVVSFVKDLSNLIYWSQGALASLFMYPPLLQGGTLQRSSRDILLLLTT